MNAPTYTVGQLAARCGVAVKTVQYYAEEGLLQARGGTTDAGYRLFTEGEVEDLRAIRTFRALGFSLDSIRDLMRGSADARTIAQLQLDVVDMQLRALRRQRTILAAALESPSSGDLPDRLRLAAAAASLGAAERDAAVFRFVDRVRNGSPLEAESRMRRMLAMDLPDDLSDAQLEAWLELSALLQDDAFVATIRAQHTPFASRPGASEETSSAFANAIGPIVGDAVAALDDRCDANSERVAALVGRWAGAFAKALGRTDDAEFRRWLVEYAQQTNDQRIQRFWELVAVLKGHAHSISPFIAAQQLLIDGLKARMR